MRKDMTKVASEDLIILLLGHLRTFLIREAADAVFFGDDNDDIEPIRECGCGVAVSNALDSVKAAADFITESNDEDGVARFLSGLTEREHRGNL